VTRGDVYELRLRPGTGHEQRGRRYGVVVQADEFAALSTVLVAPTSTGAHAASWRPEIDVRGARTRVLVEQTGAVDVSRLGRRVAHVSHEERWSIDDALRLVLALT
jgi:mRNA interferase MazF